MMAQSADTDLTLFPLNRAGSPFIESGFTNAFQYYLLVKNSPASIPFGVMPADSPDWVVE